MDPMISPNALSAALDTARPPVVLDVRWSLAAPDRRAEYLAGHVPGAVFVDFDAAMSGPPGTGGRHPLPDPMTLQEHARRWGLRTGDSVVTYDDGETVPAARAWWLLRWAGVAAVRVLDGGIAAWRAAGLPLTSEVPDPAYGDVALDPGHMPVLDADAAARTAREGALLDVRAAERYRGEEEPIDPVAGHIPGARSAPATANAGVDGLLLPPDRLRAHFTDLGVDPSRPVGAYCGSGVTAANEVLALERAGVPAALYVGSWSEWVTDPSRPVATGPDPG